MILISVDLMNGKVVRLLRGNPKDIKVYSDDPISVANYWLGLGYSIHIVDLDAAIGRGSNHGIIRRILELNGFKEVSGGIRDPESAIRLLKEGASRVVIGTMAFTDRGSLLKLKGLKVAISLDVLGESVFIYGWQKVTGINYIKAMNELTAEGFEEFEVTFINLDGTRKGLKMKHAMSIPEYLRKHVILSGGLRLEDAEVIRDMGFEGCIIGSDAYERIYMRRNEKNEVR